MTVLLIIDYFPKNINILVFVIKTQFISHAVTVSCLNILHRLRHVTRQADVILHVWKKKNLCLLLPALRFQITSFLVHMINYINGIAVPNMGCTTAHHVHRNFCVQTKLYNLMYSFYKLMTLVLNVLHNNDNTFCDITSNFWELTRSFPLQVGA